MKDVILQAIRDNDLRIENGSRWMVIHKDDTLVVYEHRPYARHTTTIIETKNKVAAVKALLEE